MEQPELWKSAIIVVLAVLGSGGLAGLLLWLAMRGNPRDQEMPPGL